MAESKAPVVVRPKLLTNSAAEFIENHIDSALEMEISTGAQAEFVAEHDRFEILDSITSGKLCEESGKMIKEFEATLERFTKTLEKHDLAKKIDVTLKRPSEYNLRDVLQIAEKVYERHQNAEDIKSCTGAIRKCFRFVGKNASPLQCLLNFVPNDTYGSVISGGFTVILAAAERAENLRGKIYTALEEIPKRLRIVQALSDVNYRSERLYLAADSVFVCLFNVLDRIVDELSKNMAKKSFKAVVKGRGYGSEIDEALKRFEEALIQFKEESHICSQQRLGRVEHMVMRVENKLEEALSRGKAVQEPEIRRDQATVDVLNKMYKLLTSNDSFDPRTGRARKPGYLLTQDEDTPVLVLSKSVTPKPSPKLNEKILKRWLAYLPIDLVSEAMKNISESLQANLYPAQENQVQYIMTSESLLNWLAKPQSGGLIIQAETAPQTQSNAISFSSAFLAQSLKESRHEGPVLYHSCGLRTEKGPRGAETSGTIALINSLNLQLAHQLRDHADLSFLRRDKYRRKSQKILRLALRVLKRLFREIPKNESVFIIIDSLSRLSGSDMESEADAIKHISRLIARSSETGPIVKALMTDLLPEHRSQAAATGDELYVPDRVDVGGHGLNTEYLREVSGAFIRRFDAGRRADGSSSGTTEYGEELDSSDDDFDTSEDGSG